MKYFCNFGFAILNCELILKLHSGKIIIFFFKMKAIILRRFSTSSSKFKLSRVLSDIYLTPPVYDKTLIWLHGLGDTADGYLDFFINFQNSLIIPNTRIMMLTAPSNPVTLNGGCIMPSWYDIKEGLSVKNELSNFEKMYSFEEIKENTARINEVIDTENKNDKTIILGGFSQGCAMTLHVALENEKVKKAYGFSGYLFPITKILNKKLEIFLCHGQRDQVVNINEAEKSYARIKNQIKSWHKDRFAEHGFSTSILENFIKNYN